MKTKPVKISIPLRRRVLLVDDHPLMREGVSNWINREPDLEICGQTDTAEKALGLVKTLRPDIVVTDLGLPGRDGFQLIKDLSETHPGLPILVLSINDESFYAERALRAGAKGYLMKEAGGDTLLIAIRQVLAGEVYVSRKVATILFDALARPKARDSRSPIETLSDREFGIFRLISEGKASKEIAGLLRLGYKTVDVHRANIKRKLKIPSGAGLISYAVHWFLTKERTGKDFP